MDLNAHSFLFLSSFLFSFCLRIARSWDTRKRLVDTLTFLSFLLSLILILILFSSCAHKYAVYDNQYLSNDSRSTVAGFIRSLERVARLNNGSMAPCFQCNLSLMDIVSSMERRDICCREVETRYYPCFSRWNMVRYASLDMS